MHGRTALHLVSEKGYLTVARKLVSARAYVNVLDHQGVTPLMCAAERGHLRVVKYLIESGADISIKNAKSNCAAIGEKGKKFHDTQDVIDLLKDIERSKKMTTR